MIINPSKAKGKMTAPPSKSMAHRHLICAALAQAGAHKTAPPGAMQTFLYTECA